MLQFIMEEQDIIPWPKPQPLEEIQQLMGTLSLAECKEIAQMQEEKLRLQQLILIEIESLFCQLQETLILLRKNPLAVVDCPIMSILDEIQQLLKISGQQIQEPIFTEEDEQFMRMYSFLDPAMRLGHEFFQPIINIMRKELDWIHKLRITKLEQIIAKKRKEKIKKAVDHHFLTGTIKTMCRLRQVEDKIKISQIITTDGNLMLEIPQVNEDNQVIDFKRCKFNCFDIVLPLKASQSQVFAHLEFYTNAAFEGKKSTIILHGPTGTGKTYAGFGDAESDDHKGIIYRALMKIVALLDSYEKQGKKYYVNLSSKQIRENQTIDVLSDLKIGQLNDYTKVFEEKITSYMQGLETIKKIFKQRDTAETFQNTVSSRSFLCIYINIFHRNRQTYQILTGSFNMLDFAGCQKVDKIKDTKAKQKTSSFINGEILAVMTTIKDLEDNQPGNYKSNRLVKQLGSLLHKKSLKFFVATGSTRIKQFESMKASFTYFDQFKRTRPPKNGKGP